MFAGRESIVSVVLDVEVFEVDVVAFVGLEGHKLDSMQSSPCLLNFASFD